MMSDFSSGAEKPMIDMLVFFDPQQRINIMYLLSALFLALISYVTFRNSDDTNKPETRNFLSYVFPKGVYTHKSAIQDYAYVLVNVIIYYVGISQLLITANACANVMHQLFISLGGPLQTPVLTTTFGKVIFTAGSILAFDFALFWQHYLMHKIPILWHFHKVHHSAEVLTPITLYRMHPIDLLLSGFLAAVFGGTFYGLFWYLSGNQPQEYIVLGLNVVVFLFYIFGYNLRHSQIWFNYPGWLSHIVVSPAQHQVHHSTQFKHWDKNMGLIFAFWDKMFGTLYVPKHYEKLEYGISKKEPNPFNSVWDLYVAPFKWTWASLKDPKERQKAFPLFLFLAVVAVFFISMNQLIQSKTLPSVYMEDLTWVEIKQAMNDGYDTVIIPVGGTEQNATHMVLGKHNEIIHYTTGEIAKEIGKAFVAPVIAYVPEGHIFPPDDNMVLSGTVSVSDEALEAVLRNAAQSYTAQGFHYIFFIGDHGLDQKPQEKVAMEFKSKDVVVVSIGDYYRKNGQIDWLKAKGYTMAEIGTHAGIRDTSEMMFVHPQGIRKNPIGKPNEYGNNGDFTKASRSIGEKMIRLKIDAAIAQIMPYLKDRKAPAIKPVITKPDSKKKLPAEKIQTSDG